MSFPVLLWGGPLDGKEYVLAKDETVVKFITMQRPEYVMKVNGPPTAIQTNYVTYLRTKKIAHGARLYRYVPNG